MVDGRPSYLEPRAGARVVCVGGCHVRRPVALRVNHEPWLDWVDMGEGGRNRALPSLRHASGRDQMDERHVREDGLQDISMDRSFCFFFIFLLMVKLSVHGHF